MASPQSTLLMFDGFTPDAVDYGDSGLEYISGMVWHSGMYQAARAAVDSSAGSAIAAVPGTATFASVPDGGGVLRYPNFFGTATTLYRWYGDAATPVSLAGVAAVGATHWSWARFGNSVIACDIGNPVKVSASLGATANLITSVLTPRAKYVTVIKNHVFLAHTDDGAAGAVAPQQFWWSARNNAANFQPGSNRAGYASVRADVGQITGVVGFEDFGVLFCEFGIYRIDYIGGDVVWSLRQIGASSDGLEITCQDSLAVLGQDVYYWSRCGPNVVRSGEATQQLGLGEVRRYLGDQVHSGRLRGIATFGSACGERPIVVWLVPHFVGSGEVWAIVTYNAAEGRWSEVENLAVIGGAGERPVGINQRVQPTTGFVGYPLDDVDFLYLNEANGYPMRRRYNNSLSTLTGFLRTRIWTPEPGKRHRVHAVRPIVRAISGSGTAVSPQPAVSVAFMSNSDPTWTDTPTTVTLSGSGDRDANGYLVGQNEMPVVGQVFQAEVTLPALTSSTASDMWSVVAGLEIVHNEESIF